MNTTSKSFTTLDPVIQKKMKDIISKLIQQISYSDFIETLRLANTSFGKLFAVGYWVWYLLDDQNLIVFFQ